MSSTDARSSRAAAARSPSSPAERPTEHVHLAFAASHDETVERFHRNLTEAGYRDNGAPGQRAVYHLGYYAAFVLDPDGNNIEVVNHNR